MLIQNKEEFITGFRQAAIQELDSNEQKSKPEKGIAYATGGGRYELPLKDYRDAKIKIRNYLEYEEDTMQLYISDWRIIGFSKERGE